MKVLWSWLLELCDLDRQPTTEEGARALTRGGLEIEGMTNLGAGFTGVVVAEVRAVSTVDDDLRHQLLSCWTDVSNAGGAVGFVPPVVAADVAPVLDRLLDGVRDGRDVLAVLTEVDERRTGSVRPAIEIDAVVPQKRADVIEVVHRDVRRVQANVGVVPFEAPAEPRQRRATPLGHLA